MAKRTTTTLVDDIDGGEATTTVTFGYDGKSYELDLSEQNAADMRDAMAPYLAVARQTSNGRTPRGAARGSRGGGEHQQRLSDIRSWARAHGHDVSDRGRISRKVVEAYDAAH